MLKPEMVPKSWWSKEKVKFHWSPAEWVAREQRYRSWCEQRKNRKKPEAPKREKGYLYFFESVTGWFKAGRTTSWKQRRRQYQGPAEPKRVFIMRRVNDMKKAEKQLLTFLNAHGYHRKSKMAEWFTREPSDSLSVTFAKW